jgi:hypothetical protein
MTAVVERPTVPVVTDQPHWHLASARNTLASRPWCQGRPALRHGAAFGIDGALAAAAGLLTEDGWLADPDPTKPGEVHRWIAIEEACAYLCRVLDETVGTDHVHHLCGWKCLVAVQEWQAGPGPVKADALALLDRAIAVAEREYVESVAS